jgi:hypothetical protein
MQMELAFMQDGGLEDDGGQIDPQSGNEVPSGSLKEEVKDDIPTMLSEGEFVFPADVVRYIGLEKLMVMRQDAKQGLKQMESMGQMGNSDEATMPDDLPFGMSDIVIMAGGPKENDEPQKMQTGGVSTQVRNLASSQPVPMRTTSPNITLPTIPKGYSDTDATTKAKNILNPVIEQPKVVQPTQIEDPRDSVQMPRFDPQVNARRGTGFDQYGAEDFLTNAQSQENIGAKLLSFTPISILGNMSYASGSGVAKEALKTGVMPVTKVEMDNPFTGEKGRTVGGEKLTAFDKVALAKYLTVERPTNSILESVGKLIGSVFSPTDEKEEVKDDAEAKEIATILEEAGVKLLEDGKIEIDGTPYVDFDDAINKLRIVHYAQRDDLEYNPETGKVSRKIIRDEYGNDVGKRFEFHGITNLNGRSIMYRGDAHGSGHRGAELFHVDDPVTGKREFFSIDQLEALGIQTTGLGATERILNFLSKVNFETRKLDEEEEDNNEGGSTVVKPKIQTTEDVKPLYGRGFVPSDIGTDPAKSTDDSSSDLNLLNYKSGGRGNDPRLFTNEGSGRGSDPRRFTDPSEVANNQFLSSKLNNQNIISKQQNNTSDAPQDPSEVSTDFKADVVPAPMYPPSDPVKKVTKEEFSPNIKPKDTSKTYDDYKDAIARLPRKKAEERQEDTTVYTGGGAGGNKFALKSGGLAKMKTKPTKKRKGGLASKKK